MTLVRIVAFEDVDVSDGLRKLLTRTSGVNGVVYPEGLPKLEESVNTVSNDFDIVPMKKAEPLEGVEEGNILAFVWDDSDEVNKAYLSVEDYGLATWDISDGLSAIEAMPDQDDLEAIVVSSFLDMLDAMVDYISENVMTMIEHQLEHMAEDGDDDE